MLTALLILAILLAIVTVTGFVSVCLYEGGFFCWWFVVPQVVKGFGYAIAFLFTLIGDINS